MENEKPRFRPWPKKKSSGGRVVLDRERIKEQYLLNPKYEFKHFCEDRNYNYLSVRKNGQLPFRAWQQEWLARQTEIQDDEIVRQAIQIRPTLLLRNLNYVQGSAWTADTLKAIYDYHLSKVSEDIRHDVENRAAIEAGTVRARHRLTSNDMMLLSVAGEKVDALMRSSLLLPEEKVREKILSLPEMTPEQRAEADEGEALRNMPIEVMGSEGMTAEQLTQQMAGYFDQLASSDAPIPAQTNAEGSNPPTVTDGEFDDPEAD